jgi:hypothetical protein
MIKITKEIMKDDDTEFIKVENSDEMAVFFQGDYHCFYNHLISIGINKSTAVELRETYKLILK